MVTPTSNPLGYLGIDSPNPRDTVYRRRDPTVNDLRPYKLGDRWLNTQTASAFILVSKTNAVADWEAIGGGATQVASLSGNDLIAVPPVAGNINVLGSSGLILSSGGPGNLLITDLRDFGPFVVSTIPGESEYSSIQTALNAAAGTGAVVYVLPGVYTENITLPSQCALVGLVPNPIDEKVEVDGNLTANAGTTKIQVMGIVFVSATNALTCTTGSPDASFYQCTFSGTSQGVRAVNAGGSSLLFVECNVAGTAQGIDAGVNASISVAACRVSGGASYRAASNAVMLARESIFSGSVSLNSTAFMSAKSCIFNGGGVSCATLVNVGTEMRAIYCEMNSTAASTFIVDGIGTLRKALLVATDTATTLDPGLTVTTYPTL